MRLSLFLICSLALRPQESKEPRESETVRYKEFAEIVELIAADVEQNEKAVVVWLVDNATMLKASKHGELLADAIPRCFKKAGVSHAVMALGETPKLLLKPSPEPARAAAAITALANAAPDNAVKNGFAHIREAARVASGSGGKKYIVLFTQENADNEDDVEGTLKTLKVGGISLLPIVPEAIYSDPYWESALAGTSSYAFDVEKFKKLPFKLKGPESAFLEFPYGWPFAWMDPGYTVPSGYAPWAIDRLATFSGGKSYLYSVDRTVEGFCRRYSCSLCSGDHKACGASFETTKLKVTQPFLGSRNEYGARYGKDKLYLAVLKIWERLASEGVFRGPPPLKGGGGALSENLRSDKAKPVSRFSHTVGEWKAQRQEAIKHADSVEKSANELLGTARNQEKEADRRTLATAEALGVHLKILAQSYRQFAAFCEEMDRVGKVKKPASDGVAASDLEPAPGDRLLTWYHQNFFLCHGGAALKEIRFLGDPKGLHEALDLADQMIEKHRGTPWEVLIRRASVPAFTVWYETEEDRKARASQPERPTARSTSGQTQNETPGSGVGRPARPARGDEGRAGPGTATGGGSK